MKDIVVPTFYCLSRPIPEGLKEIAEAGAGLVEIHGDAPDRHIDLTNDSQVTALAQAIQGLPLEIHSVHCAFSQPNEETWDISQPDADLRKEAIRRRIKVIESAAKLNARHVVFHPGVRDRGKECLPYALDALTKLVDAARKNGVKIAVENLPPDQLGGALEEITMALRDLDPEVAGFCLDTGHAMLGQNEPCDFIRALGDRLIAIHWHTNDGKDDQHLFPGDNQVRWESFFAALDEVGYDLPITVEAVPPKGIPAWRAVQEARAAIRQKRTPELFRIPIA